MPEIEPPPLPWSGGCQCGAVRYAVTKPPLTLYACHCRECQRQSSSAFGLSMRLPADGLAIDGTLGLARRSDPTAPPVDGLFCPRCGVRIAHRRPGRDTVNLKPGTLDDTRWLRPVGHLWARSAQAGSRPPPGPLTYEGQTDGYDALIAAWARATGGEGFDP